MSDELLTYYERELTFLRQMGGEFAAKYPKIASRLLLEKDKCEDPHVERLIQAFAFLAGRIHCKLDDDLPELTDALLGILYPHYLAPLPSMAIAQFGLDPEVSLTTAHRIERGALLYSQPVNDTPCRFRTCYPVTLWPVEVVSASLESPDRYGPARKAAAVLRLELRCLGDANFTELGLKELRFFLHGESQLTYALYELLLNDTSHVQLRPLKDPSEVLHVDLSADCLRPVGFSADEGMLPYPPRSFLGYRLLQEYFAFPEKFLFFDVCELDRAAKPAFQSGLEVLIFLKRFPHLEQPINADTFRLGCTPVINLFEQIAEPIRLNHAQTEYQVIPDVRRRQCLEVYSIDKVLSTSPQEEPIEFQPFYSFTHAAQQDGQPAYWHVARRPSAQKGDPGTEVYLSLVGLDYQPTLPPIETLTIHTTCTNRDLPAKLPFGGDRGDFELEGAAPLSRIRCLTKPTEPIRALQRHAAQWRLISSLSLNYLSIVEVGREALQELLRLYNFADSSVIRQQIAGIISVTSRRVTARSPHLFNFYDQDGEENGRRLMPWNGFCRGIKVTIEFDETKYVGSGLFLFASVLERFLALYASLNSFTQMVARTQQREEALRQWPPRAGEQILL